MKIHKIVTGFGNIINHYCPDLKRVAKVYRAAYDDVYVIKYYDASIVKLRFTIYIEDMDSYELIGTEILSAEKYKEFVVQWSKPKKLNVGLLEPYNVSQKHYHKV